MNKTTLKSKWYYRLLVVIYIGFFLLTLISTVVVNFNTIGNYQTDFEIKCHKGNKETFFAYQEKNLHLSRYADVIDPENWSSSEDPNELGVMSIATEGCGLSKVSAQSYLNKGENIFTAKLKKV